MSRTGKTGILRSPDVLVPDALTTGGAIEGWFVIECPRINFPSLDSADFEKFQDSASGNPCLRPQPAHFSLTRLPMYEQLPDNVPPPRVSGAAARRHRTGRIATNLRPVANLDAKLLERSIGQRRWKVSISGGPRRDHARPWLLASSSMRKAAGALRSPFHFTSMTTKGNVLDL